MTTLEDDDYDGLSGTQQLLLEVLAARHRLGESVWTFSTKTRKTAEKLKSMGLINVIHGITERTYRASLTDQGRNLLFDPLYEVPIRTEEVTNPATARSDEQNARFERVLASASRDTLLVINDLHAAHAKAVRENVALLERAQKAEATAAEASTELARIAKTLDMLEASHSLTEVRAVLAAHAVLAAIQSQGTEEEQ